MAVQHKESHSTKQLALVGFFAALTFLATSILKIPTPTFGYIHIGDGFVLLAGFLLGPLYGGLAAGIGSALSDLLGGYAVWVPGTFLIKFLTALLAAVVLRRLFHKKNTSGPFLFSAPNASSSGSTFATPWQILLSGLAGELVMVVGYFLYNILIVSTASGDASIGLAAAAAVSLAEIPFNLIQGAVGLGLASILYPLVQTALRRTHMLSSL